MASATALLPPSQVAAAAFPEGLRTLRCCESLGNQRFGVWKDELWCLDMADTQGRCLPKLILNQARFRRRSNSSCSLFIGVAAPAPITSVDRDEITFEVLLCIAVLIQNRKQLLQYQDVNDFFLFTQR
ncbi:hypothetical protein Chor_012516 [Crotalus horridus]